MNKILSMLAIDFRRMFTMPLLYIMAAVCFVIPVLILVMTSSMAGDGGATFSSAWDIIASAQSSAGMDMTSMCNINLLYFLMAVTICIFVADDFRSGYAKNIFTVRSKRIDYVISKILVGFVAGVIMLLAFFVGAVIGGGVAGLSFGLGEYTAFHLVACMLSKMFVALIFVGVFVLASLIGKQKLWLSMIASMVFSMLFFNVVPMLTPLASTMVNVLITFVAGVLVSAIMGTIGVVVLRKTRIV